MSDVLKKPVHIALLRPTQLDKLAAQDRVTKTPFGLDPKNKLQPLPTEPKPEKLVVPKSGLKAVKAQVRLKVLYNNLPSIPADKIPPCDTCKTAACCQVYVVNITEMEYDSGLFGDAAVKLTVDMYNQLHSKFMMLPMLTAPRQLNDNDAFYLEGKIGEPCPFLTPDKKCSIYDIRPKTCRVYTCVGDARITEGMRQGTEPIDAISLLMKAKNK